MKTTISLTCLISGILLSANVGAAPAAGAASGAAAPAVSPGTTVPGTGPRIMLPPGATTQPGPDRSSGTVTATATTNPVSPGTNMLGMATNRMQGSNNSTTAESNSGLQDHAVTASDRTLLITLTATVSGQLGTTSRGAMPVHFLISSGAVTLVGTVSTADESQRILARVQQTPGVLSVFNDLHVGTPAQTASAQTSLLGATTDHAFSPKDQSLLTAVQQAAGRQLGVSGASAAQMPVHFSIENGVVGVTGQVSSLQEKQALLAAVQRTPGVVRVADNVTIANVAAGGVNGALPATSRDLNQSNSIFLNQTNSSGF